MAVHLGLKLPLSGTRAGEVTRRARKYAQAHGLISASSPCSSCQSDVDQDTSCSQISVTLLPTPIDENVYHPLNGLQTAYAELYHKAAHDHAFLETHLKPLADLDDFLSRLWGVHEQVKDLPPEEHRCLLMARNDFMLDGDQPKHVEFNTVSVASFGWGRRIRDYHCTTMRSMGLGDWRRKIPDSNTHVKGAKAMVDAMKTYPNGVIMFVIEEDNRNVYDQIHLESEIYRLDPDIKIIHKTLREIDETGHLKDRTLFVDGHEIGMVYYRTAYKPQLMHGEMGWRVRLLMEKSRAILCPCVHTHLAGLKKIQQVLCNPGMVEKYITDPVTACMLRSTFAHQYPTDQTIEGNLAVQLVKEDPEKYILKSQQEGGGGKFFGPAIVEELERLENSYERGKYVLMERIHPPQNANYVLFGDGRMQYGDTVSEIGFFLSSFWDVGNIDITNCGPFVKTKMADQNEGGLLIGIAGIDSLLLV